MDSKFLIFDFRFSIPQTASLGWACGLVGSWAYKLISLLAYKPMSLLAASCVFFSSFAGCGEDVTEGALDAGERVDEGWKEYTAGNYENAIAKFEKALEVEQAASLFEGLVSAEAYNGIGWAKARSGQVQDSIDSFKKAVEKEPDNADAHAGLAGRYLVDGDYERAIASANSVLSLQPEYTSHHDDINAVDIRVLLAECYYNIGDYAAARAQIDLLGSSGRGLNPASPTYLADLLLIIEELSKKGS